MKNTKELRPILASLFIINQTSENKDPDIALILDYAFRTFFGENTNLFILACLSRTKEEIMPDVHQILEESTKFMDYIKELGK